MEAYLGLTKVLPVFFVTVGGGALTVVRLTAASAGTANAHLNTQNLSTDYFYPRTSVSAPAIWWQFLLIDFFH